MDYTALKGLKLSLFESAADGYRTTSDMACQAKDRIDHQITAKMRGTLEGEAVDAALRQLGELSKNFHYAQVECGLVSTALNGLVSDLRAARKKLDAAVEDAQGEKFTVEPDGSVTYPAAGEKVDGKTPRGGTVKGNTYGAAQSVQDQAAMFDPNPNYARAKEYANRIAAAVEEATEADLKWAPKLRKLKADDDLTVSHKDWADAQKDMHGVRKAAEDYLDGIKPPPTEGTPEENAEWWKGLSDTERDDYVSLHPAGVGALDGIPAEVRDEANRAVLAEKRGRYETELRSIPPEPTRYFQEYRGNHAVRAETAAWKEWNDKYGDRKEHLEGSLKGMQAIQDRFDATGEEGLPDAYLLGFSPEGNGRSIIANGNPDTADRVAVYVPGTTSNLGSIGGDINRMTSLWRESQAMAQGQNISTITWLGYDAPQSIVKDAPMSHYADDGAPALNRFLDGLETSNSTESGGHRTAIGHSYGTTLIGSAARQGGLNADDVVLVGSPGVQVGHARDLDAPPGHVWNEEADGDVVPDIGRYGHGGSQWTIGGGTFIIPSDELFGANRMSTDTTGHSDYWGPGTESLKNQAAVVAGQYDRVEIEE
ncbi:hypothetical protein SUDANB106_04175 [Streptomyces sp. enrichment culture]|uniref:alpha/beta hydrolase n=1 Tax=Streptomyces sp. enrichment culture TaxID=1795815 RepID=UPI003F57288F